MITDNVNKLIETAKKINKIETNDISDTYHTFGELYHHRAVLFAAICKLLPPELSWKSLQHNSQDDPIFGDGEMFIVGIQTPYGQATYHYNIDPYWDMYDFVTELPEAPKWDGHTPKEAIHRIEMLLRDK